MQELVGARRLSAAQAEEVVKALRASGAGSSDGALLSTVQSFQKDGWSAFMQAIDASVATSKARAELATVTVQFKVPSVDREFALEGREGETLFELVKEGSELAEYLECACQGKMMCSTCHVYVDEATMARTGPPEEAEQDLLDIAFEPKDTSRLGCQVVLHKDVPTMTISIPDDSVNLFN